MAFASLMSEVLYDCIKYTVFSLPDAVPLMLHADIGDRDSGNKLYCFICKTEFTSMGSFQTCPNYYTLVLAVWSQSQILKSCDLNKALFCICDTV